jgi:hypothetical protein
MTTRTATLVEFLTARLDEDEAAAQAAADPPWTAEIMSHVDAGSVTHQTWEVGRNINFDYLGDDHEIVSYGTRDEGDGQSEANARHIARHDPARVLAEVDAKRRIVADYERGLGRRRDHPGDAASAGALLALHAVARLLALPYTDHPDYDEAWRP